MYFDECLEKISNVVNERNTTVYRHPFSGKFLILPTLKRDALSLWRFKKTLDVNPACLSRMALFITLTVDAKKVGCTLNLTSKVREFLNRVNTMLRMRAIRKNKKFYKPMWIWRIEEGPKYGNRHVHLMTNYHYLNYMDSYISKKEKCRKKRMYTNKKGKRFTLADWVESVWRLGKMNKFEKLYDDSGRLEKFAQKKIKKYLEKYMKKKMPSISKKKKILEKGMEKSKDFHISCQFLSRIIKIQANEKIKYSRIWGTTREFKFRYVSIFKHSSIEEMQKQSNKQLFAYTTDNIIKLDMNPFHHRRIPKKYKKKAAIQWQWELWNDFIGPKKTKEWLYVKSHTFQTMF